MLRATDTANKMMMGNGNQERRVLPLGPSQSGLIGLGFGFFFFLSNMLMVFILNRPALTILRKMGSRRSDALLELKGKGKKNHRFFKHCMCFLLRALGKTAF